MAGLKVIQEIEGLGKIVVSSESLDEQIQELKNAGVEFPHLISVRDASYMRIYNGPRDGTRTCHAPIHAKGSPIILAMISPLIGDSRIAKQAVETHRNNNYFVTQDTEVYDKYAKIAEADKSKEPEERRAIVLPEKRDYIIKPDTEEARALFRDTQKEYLKMFAPNGVAFRPTNAEFVDGQDGTTISYLWFRNPGVGSELDSSYWYFLYYNYGAFGVLKETSEAGSRKN